MTEGWCSPGLEEEPIDGQRWIAIDTETTGLNARRDFITEFAAVSWRHDGSPSQDVILEWRHEDAREDDLLERARRLDRFLKSGIVVAHNLDFDLAFLRQQTATHAMRIAYPRRWMCSMRAAGGFVGLDRLAQATGIEISDRHTARGDAAGLAGILKLLLGQLPAGAKLGSLSALMTNVVAREEPAPSNAGTSWEAVLDVLPRVVPIRFPTREQRAAFAEASLRLSVSTASSAEIKEVAHGLRRTGLTAIALERLLGTIQARQET